MNPVEHETVITERMVLGSMLLAPTCIAEVQSIVRAEDFLKLNHRAVFSAILRVQAPTLELPTVWQELVRSGDGKIVTLDDFQKLVSECPTSANAEHHAAKTLTLAKARRLSASCTSIVKQCSLLGELSDESLARWSQKLITEVNAAVASRRVQTVAEAMESMDPYSERHASDSLPTGLIDLDHFADLHQRGALTVVAARPRMGKTTLMRHLIRQIAPAHDVAAFSLEEPLSMLRDKLVCEVASIPYWKHLKRMASEDEKARILAAMGVVAEWKLSITDSPMDAEGVAMECRRLAYNGKPPRVVFVDHLQHMRHSRERGENDAALYGRTMITLADLAKELKCTVVLMAQLNRNVEHRDEQRPMLSDMRDSGKVEEVAFNVLFIWTDNPDAPRRSLYLAKQRNGPSGEADVRFDGEYGRFQNLSTMEVKP